MNDMRNNALGTAGKYTAYALRAAVGVSEIMAATTAAEMTLAIIDMGMLSSDFAMNEVLATRLNQTQEGKAWLDSFNKLVRIYGSTRAVVDLAGLAKEMRNSATAIDDQQVIDNTTKVSAKAVEATGLLDNAYLSGWSSDRVLSLKPTPKPSIYLKPDYVSRHLDKFNGRASYLVTGNTYRDFIIPVNSVGRQDGLFILTVNDIDQIVSSSKGNISIIETQLGIPSGSWQNKGGIDRVDVTNPQMFKLRLPSGNETGANGFWLPGGILPTGNIEAVVNTIPKSNIVITKINE